MVFLYSAVFWWGHACFVWASRGLPCLLVASSGASVLAGQGGTTAQPVIDVYDVFHQPPGGSRSLKRQQRGVFRGGSQVLGGKSFVALRPRMVMNQCMVVLNNYGAAQALFMSLFALLSCLPVDAAPSRDRSAHAQRLDSCYHLHWCY